MDHCAYSLALRKKNRKKRKKIERKKKREKNNNFESILMFVWSFFIRLVKLLCKGYWKIQVWGSICGFNRKGMEWIILLGTSFWHLTCFSFTWHTWSLAHATTRIKTFWLSSVMYVVLRVRLIASVKLCLWFCWNWVIHLTLFLSEYSFLSERWVITCFGIGDPRFRLKDVFLVGLAWLPTIFTLDMNFYDLLHVGWVDYVNTCTFDTKTSYVCFDS